jgi:hypothetical protein
MKSLPWCAIAFLIFTAGSSEGQGPRVPTAYLFRFDLQKKPPRDRFMVAKGDVLEFYISCPTKDQEKTLKTLKVQHTEDLVVLVGVYQIPEATPDGRIDSSKRTLCCVVRLADAGDATVSITPFGEDGAERSTRKFDLKIYEKLKRPSE